MNDLSAISVEIFYMNKKRKYLTGDMGTHVWSRPGLRPAAETRSWYTVSSCPLHPNFLQQIRLTKVGQLMVLRKLFAKIVCVDMSCKIPLHSAVGEEQQTWRAGPVSGVSLRPGHWSLLHCSDTQTASVMFQLPSPTQHQFLHKSILKCYHCSPSQTTNKEELLIISEIFFNIFNMKATFSLLQFPCCGEN